MMIEMNFASGGATKPTYDVFSLGENLGANATKDFSVKSSDFKFIGFRGNNTDGLRVCYFSTPEQFASGVYGWWSSPSLNGSDSFNASYIFTFPNEKTMRFKNIIGSTLDASTQIVIGYLNA